MNFLHEPNIYKKITTPMGRKLPATRNNRKYIGPKQTITPSGQNNDVHLCFRPSLHLRPSRRRTRRGRTGPPLRRPTSFGRCASCPSPSTPSWCRSSASCGLTWGTARAEGPGLGRSSSCAVTSVALRLGSQSKKTKNAKLVNKLKNLSFSIFWWFFLLEAFFCLHFS